MTNLTLGSLFDGSGGFLLAGKILGIEPKWASEVEAFPILVTRKNLPSMKHLGDITKINVEDIEPVDIITFGSPCQDLSIAGKRAGLHGNKSNLFYEAIRIIKEMRRRTNGEYPKIIVWENVFGVFSSKKGEDFRCVLEEISKIADENISIPRFKKWKCAGNIVGRDFSIAWRVLDAQYFGVPQRRRRVFLVADFRGEGAGEILFNEKSMPRYFKTSTNEKEKATGNIRKSTDITEYSLMDQGGLRMDVEKNKVGTLRARSNNPPLIFENHGQDSRFKGPIEKSQTLSGSLGMGGNNQPFVVENYDIRLTSLNTKSKRSRILKTDVSRTLGTTGNNPIENQGGLAIVSVYSTSKSSHHTVAIKNQSSTLMASDYKDPPIVANKYLVRKITPLECSRLQGFPDFWCSNLEIINPSEEELKFWKGVFECRRQLNNGKRNKSDKQIKRWLANPYSDSVQYKMWGNAVALPCVLYVLSGVKAFLKK